MTPPGRVVGSDVVGSNRFPHRERHVLHPVVDLGTARAAQFADGGLSGGEADHPLHVGDGDEERSVGVSGPQERIDLEDGATGVTGIDAGAVVDDPLEHRQRPDPHATMLA